MPIARNGSIEIYYEIHGHGEPLVMINGLGGDHIGLELHQMPAFAPGGYRCILLDNRGIGRSSMPDQPYTTRDMAADVACVLRKADCPQAHIAGWSMGGAIAQHLAVRYPQHVMTLQLHCTWSRTDPYLAWQFDRRRAALTGIGREELFRSVLLSTFTPSYFNDHAAEMEPAISAMLSEPSGQQPEYSYLRQLDACRTHDAEDGLSAIGVPVLITAGAEDPLISPRFAHRLNALLPGSTLKLIPGAAHGHSLERPKEFRAACHEFLRAHTLAFHARLLAPPMSRNPVPDVPKACRSGLNHAAAASEKALHRTILHCPA